MKYGLPNSGILMNLHIWLECGSWELSSNDAVVGHLTVK